MNHILGEARRRLRGVSIEEAILLTEIGELSYYLFEGGVLMIRGSEDRDLPYLKAVTRVIPFEGLPEFLSREVKRWLEERE